ncbi:MAG: glycyl radical protein [Candidatus Thorarchaeota archaeon]
MVTSRVEALRNLVTKPIPHVSIERPVLYTESMRATEGEPMILRQAKALASVLDGMPIRIHPGEIIVGAIVEEMPGATVYPEAHGTRVVTELEDLRTREHGQFSVSDEAIRTMTEEIGPYWNERSMLAHVEENTPEEVMDALYSGSVFVLTEMAGIGHVSINYPMLFSRGFEKISSDAETRIQEYDGMPEDESKSKALFYKSAKIVADAIIRFADRYADLAIEMSESEEDSGRREELGRIAGVCRRVPAKPPRSLHEALQFVRFTHLALTLETYDGQAISLGRMDQYLQSFYEADIKSGAIDHERAVQLIEMLWIKLNELVPLFDSIVGLYFDGLLTTQAATIGGMDKSGRDSTNDMTGIILEATRKAALPVPNVHVRIHESSPNEYLTSIAETVVSGVNNIAIFNDEIIVESLTRKEIPIEEARDYATVGCVELAPFGTSFTSSDAALFNLAMCFELALNNGESILLGEKRGVESGDPLTFNSIEDFVEAFRKQVSYLVGLMTEGSNHFEKTNMELKPTPFLSLCVEDCFTLGNDITTGSARYNFTGVQGVGMADVADSLAAIDQLVFRENKVSIEDLLQAIKVGFEGHESLRQLLLNRAPKYGNDDKLADEYARLVASIYSEEVEKHENIRGGPFIPGMYSVSTHVPFGYFTGALPSGRMPTTSLSNGASPTIGTTRNGLTAAIRSATKVDYTLYPNGIAFTLALDHGFAHGEEGLEALVSLLRSYVELGGMQIQFNMMDSQRLIDAKNNPEAHRNLIVRVAGYSAYFVDLSEDVQDEIIGRFMKSG